MCIKSWLIGLKFLFSSFHIIREKIGGIREWSTHFLNENKKVFEIRAALHISCATCFATHDHQNRDTTNQLRHLLSVPTIPHCCVAIFAIACYGTFRWNCIDLDIAYCSHHLYLFALRKDIYKRHLRILVQTNVKSIFHYLSTDSIILMNFIRLAKQVL